MNNKENKIYKLKKGEIERTTSPFNQCFLKVIKFFLKSQLKYLLN